MSIITHGYESDSPPCLWEQVCQDTRKEQRDLAGHDMSEEIDCSDYDPVKHHPAFCGTRHYPMTGDFDPEQELNPAVGHPSCAGYCTSIMHRRRTARLQAPSIPDKKTCSNREYIDHFVWPYVEPALEHMMNKAKFAGCFQNRRAPINSFDILTEYLYNNNPMHPFRARKPLAQIPFVESHLEDFPRLNPPKVLSMSWTADERAVLIHRWCRGFAVRQNPEVQEMRKWQREWRAINREANISAEVSRFWERVMPSGNSNTATSPTDSTSEASSSTQLPRFTGRPRAKSIAPITRYTAKRNSPSQKPYHRTTQLLADIHMGERPVDDEGRLRRIENEC
ncbi:IQ domain-containing protein K-like [Littorina saxatilis]|uniref:Uncharacterized protein n=1 Tax=Littorina saxatilis TaxID=31220 RepID=A0AAN9BRW5_9CAEN